MANNNAMDVDDEKIDDSLTLSYKTDQEKALHVSKVAEHQANMKTKHNNIMSSNLNPQCILNKEHQSNTTCSTTTQMKDNIVINIQLPYNSQAPTEPDLQSGNFYPISLHSLIEYIALDTKNIKDSLNFIARYIANKQINSSKTNDLEDFNGIGESIWNFISSVYHTNQNTLYADNQSNSLRKKIASKFTPKITPTPGKNNKETIKHVLANLKKISLLILAKSQKEINMISKYFKNNKSIAEPKKSTMSYNQASKQTMSTSEVIKIKEIFLSIGIKKIDLIYNIVKGTPKPKPYIQMTMKGPSRKQVIISISNDNNAKFMRNLATYIANINRILRNAESEVLVDFICSDPLGITVVTNKVYLQSDLQMIDHYVKNAEDIDALQVDAPCLPQSKSYLKIIGILYFPHGNSQDYLTSNDIESILKQNQIFDNITLASKLRVIKVSPKSDMSIIWIDIWNVQSGSRAKGLIN